jgi:hypothetical protein
VAPKRTLLVAAAALCASSALATPTDPTLVLTGAASATGDFARVVRVDGSFHAQDLVQIAYPLQLLVHAGATYVRFDLANGAVSGVAPALADGLQAGEAEALLAQGTPAPAARLLALGLGRLEVTLPASFPAGAAEVQLFVIDEQEAVLSNALPVAIGAAP